MNLGEVLSRAWKIIWKNKILWIFGILSSCGRGGGGGGGGNNSNFNFDNGNTPFSDGSFPGAEEFSRNMENIFGSSSEQTWIPIIIGGLCLLLIVAVVFIFLGTIGRIGLIKGTVLAETGHEPLSFGQVWSASMPYFWRVFLLNLIIGLAIGLVVLIIMVPFVLVGIATMGVGMLCLIPLFCLLIPLSLVVNVIIEQANVAMVVEELGIMDAIKRGWRVCRENLGPIAVVALVILVGGGIVGFIIAIPLVLVIVPIFAGFLSNDETVLTTLFATAGLMLCCMLPVVIALSGILQSYIGSVWTLTFLRLTAKKPEGTDPLPVLDNQVA